MGASLRLVLRRPSSNVRSVHYILRPVPVHCPLYGRVVVGRGTSLRRELGPKVKLDNPLRSAPW